ncbi:MAG: alpha/beta fold hydrolase [Actinobacteria bacterium]|nr:alpha/beta fold hydrolase [Actinomycetota bacterium]
MEIRHRSVVGAGGVRLAVFERNVDADETVVLIHGYPDNHRVWDPVADRLAERFHVVSYDVRGAGASEVPEPVNAYRLELLAEDFRAVVHAVSPDGEGDGHGGDDSGRGVHVAAHDWGSIQGWYFACDPDTASLMSTYTSISGPDLDAAGQFMRRSGETPPSLRRVVGQGVKSWYVGVFQIPRFAPAYWRSKLARATWPKMLAAVEKVPAELLPSGDDLDQAQRDGANGVKLYRANMVTAMRAPRHVSTDVPVQVVIPLRDRYVSPALAQSVAGLGDDIVFHQIDGGHWVLLNDPKRIAGLVAEHIDRQAAIAAFGWDLG